MLERPKLRQDQAVIVRVWKSRIAGGAGVGHASIEIPSISLYISLWPAAEAKPLLAGIFSPRSRVFHSLEGDITVEGRPPETTIALYSLDLGAIEAKYVQESEKLQRSGWQLIRGTLFPADTGHSCASLAYALLNAGGIYDLVSGAFSSSFSSVSRPEEVATVAKTAKRKELAEYPETADLYFAGETKIEEIGRKCTIM